MAHRARDAVAGHTDRMVPSQPSLALRVLAELNAREHRVTDTLPYTPRTEPPRLGSWMLSREPDRPTLRVRAP